MKLTEFEAQAALAEVIKKDLSVFVQQVFHTLDPQTAYMHNWHIELISDYLMACEKAEIQRLIINVPPGSLKSILVNVAWSAWLLAHNPQARILSASHSERLSIKHSVATRDIIKSNWYKSLFPRTKIRPDQDQKINFHTTLGGYRQAFSVNGSITGEGGNHLIIDDPHDAGKSESEAERTRAVDWVDRAFMSRMRDKKGGCAVVIMQRLNLGDLTGHLMEKGGWQLLSIPAVAEKKTIIDFGRFKKRPIVREEGDYLHPEREGEEEIFKVRRDIGEYGFSGQYQQRPAPIGGGFFRKEWLMFYTSSVSGTNNYILVDPANTKNKKSDYTAIWVLGTAKDGNIYVLDVYRDKYNLDERTNLIFDLHEKYKPKITAYERYGMQSDIDHIKSIMEYRGYRFNITEVSGKLSKEDRIKRLQPYFAENKIWLPKSKIKSSWENKPVDVIEEFIEQEYKVFPVGVHDDALDSLSRICDISMKYPNKTINYEAIYG